MAGDTRLVAAVFVLTAAPVALLVAGGAVEGAAELVFVLLVAAVTFFVGVLSQLRTVPGE